MRLVSLHLVPPLIATPLIFSPSNCSTTWICLKNLNNRLALSEVKLFVTAIALTPEPSGIAYRYLVISIAIPRPVSIATRLTLPIT